TQSAKIQTRIAEQNYAEAKLKVSANYHALQQNYMKWLQSWQFYQQEALPLAKEQQEGALFAFKKGGIEYTTFLQAIRDAIKIQSESWEALSHYLQAKYELEFFINSLKNKK